MKHKKDNSLNEDKKDKQQQETDLTDQVKGEKKDNIEIKDYKDAYLRVCAEMDNLRKRLDREKQEFIRFAYAGLIEDLLPMVDDLERTVSVAEKNPEHFEKFLEGTHMIINRFEDLLKKYGVKSLIPFGNQFDPMEHEVLSQVETEEFEEDQIVDVVQKGYKIYDRLLRPAKVMTAKPKKSPDTSRQSPDENKKQEQQQEDE